MTTQAKQKTCAELISARYVDREKQFSDAWEDSKINWNDYLAENTLAFDFVEPNTFKNQPQGYWRLQFSWGGPSDEIRWYKASEPGDKHQYVYDQITYVYSDWFDGAEIQVHADVWHNTFSDYYETNPIWEGQY